jgi:HlyD family secretion protein
VAGGAALLVLGVAAAAYAWIFKPFRGQRPDLVTHTVRYGRLELTIVERGQLESANNSDVYCRVKSKTQGGTVASTIRWLVDDGTRVDYDRPKEQVRTAFVWDEKGGYYNEEKVTDTGTERCVKVKDEKTGQWVYADLLLELDDSGHQDSLKTEKITLDTAESNKIQADESYKITLLQNETNIKTAEVNLELAKIELEKYQKGDFPQSLSDVEGRIKVAESDLEQQRDRAAWANRMFKKGYYTASQSQSEQSKLESYELALKKVREERRVLTEPGYGLKVRNETDFRNKVAQAERALAQAKSQALSDEVKARTDRDTKKSIYLQEQAKYKDILEEIQKCKIYTPRDGMVVYFIPEQARWGVGSRQSIVAQGESVSEGQKLMQIPDLDHMLVNTKVHEALVSRVHKGQPAYVRVDSFPDQPLRSHVDSVATIASSADFLSADVKVYTTKIAIDKTIDGLKPGMSSEVTITIGDALDHVLTVPIEAIIGSAEMGKTRKCYVITGEGPKEREVVVGMSNDRMAEVREGLKEGDEVVLNPRVLAGDKIKIRQPGVDNGGPGGATESATTPGMKGGPGAKGGPPDGKGGPPNGLGAPPGAAPGGPMQKGGPGGAPPGAPGTGQPGRGGPGGGGQFSPEDRKKMVEQMVQRFKAMPKEQRKEALEQIPEQFRDTAKQTLKSNGVEVPD